MEDPRRTTDRRRFGSPFHAWLGLEPGARSAAGAETRLAPRPEFLQEEGVIQGGVLAALLDATAVYALFPELDVRDALTSVEFKLNFLAPARLGAGAIEARADVVKTGRTLALVKCTARQDGRAVAEGLFTYLFTRGV